MKLRQPLLDWDTAIKKFDSVLIDHPRFKFARDQLDRFYKLALTSTEPVCTALVGESGCGKSRLLEEFQKPHQERRTPNGIVTPIIRVSMPRNPTPRAVLTEILNELGDGHYERGDEVDKALRIKRLALAASTRVIIVEEFQHVAEHKTLQLSFQTSDTLKRLVDEARVSLLVSGLPSCLITIKCNEQLKRRFDAPIELGRFSWEDAEDRKEFKEVLVSWQQALSHLEFPSLDSDEMAFRFFCACGGIFGYIVKLLRQVVVNAVSTNTGSVTLELLAQSLEEVVSIDAYPLGNPFDDGFTCIDTEQKLAAALDLGLRKEQELASPKGRGRATKSRS